MPPGWRKSAVEELTGEVRQAALLWVRYGGGCLFALPSHFSDFFASILSGSLRKKWIQTDWNSFLTIISQLKTAYDFEAIVDHTWILNHAGGIQRQSQYPKGEWTDRPLSKQLCLGIWIFGLWVVVTWDPGLDSSGKSYPTADRNPAYLRRATTTAACLKRKIGYCKRGLQLGGWTFRHIE